MNFVADKRLANTVTWHLNPPPNFNMRIPDEIRKSVVYLGNDEGNGEIKEIVYRGTGFFVILASEKIPNANFLFLVTAKHVADKLRYKQFYVRMNTKAGKSANLLCDTDSKWHIHPTDEAADVSVFPIGFNVNDFDCLPIPSTMFLTEKIRVEKGIGTSDEIFIAGLFVYHIGFSKNIPVIRVGSIAMVPEERIPTKDFGMMEAYLIEAHSIGGLSGSPVFVTERTIPTSMMYLMGLIHGHWQVDGETIVDETDQDAGIKANSNIGIAIVTPASKIMDIINSPEMIDRRNKLESERIAKNSPTPDKI